MAKHSEAPFSSEPAGELQDAGKFEQTIIRDAKGCEIARCTHWLVSEHDGNVSLFRAAPDLLAALKEVVAISDRKHNAWDAAKAAIAAAEGTEP